MIRERPAESLQALIGYLLAVALGLDGQEGEALVVAVVSSVAALVTFIVQRREPDSPGGPPVEGPGHLEGDEPPPRP